MGTTVNEGAGPCHLIRCLSAIDDLLDDLQASIQDFRIDLTMFLQIAT